MSLPRGVMVALATPIGPDGAVDEIELDGLVARVLDAGVVGVCPVGSTGEGPRLGRTGRLAMVEAVRARVPAGVPVIPAPAPQTAQDAVEELEAFAAAGADAALVPPPAYYPLAEGSVRRYYEEVADRSPLPLVLYNIPVFTKVAIPPAVVGALAEHPQVAGIKDSSRDMEYFTSVVFATAGAPGFSAFTGSDSLLLASVTVGGHGTIAASANLVARLGGELYRAAVDGRLDEARALQRRLLAVVQACRVGEPPSGWKAGLEVAGVCSGRLVRPAAALDDAQRAALRERLTALDVL